MQNMGESTDVTSLVDRHFSSQGLYASVVQPYRTVKYEEYRRTQPELVVIGTSRATAFRAAHFTSTFYNAAADDRNGPDLLRVYAELSTLHRPALMIFTVDYWNLTGDDLARPLPRSAMTETSGILAKPNPPEIYLTLQLFAASQLSFSQYLDGALGRFPTRSYGIDLMGVTAVQHRFGILVDGSSFEYRKAPLRKRFSKIIDQESGNERLFRRQAAIHDEPISLLLRAIEILTAKGIEVVVVAPPLAPSVAELLRQKPQDYGYIEKWRTLLRGRIPHFYDMHDAREFGATDCEFVDDIHGGEVAYIRMLLKMTEDPGHPLAGRVDRHGLMRMVEEHAGKVIVAVDVAGRQFSRLAETYYDPACDGEQRN